jgi:hypothetical protein
MMSLLNSSERDLDSWVSLFHKADARLRLLKVVQPLGSALSIMELELVDAVEETAELQTTANGEI